MSKTKLRVSAQSGPKSLSQFLFKIIGNMNDDICLIVYIFFTLISDLILMLSQPNSDNILPTRFHGIRLGLLVLAVLLVVTSRKLTTEKRPVGRVVIPVLAILAFFALSFLTFFNFGYKDINKSYGLTEFWLGLDFAVYAILLPKFIYKQSIARVCSILGQFIMAIIYYYQEPRTLSIIAKLLGYSLMFILMIYNEHKNLNRINNEKTHHQIQEEAWKKLLNALPEGVLIMNTSKEALFHNRGFLEFIDYAGSFEVNKKIYDFFQGIERVRHRETIPNQQVDVYLDNTNDNPANQEKMLKIKEKNLSQLTPRDEKASKTLDKKLSSKINSVHDLDSAEESSFLDQINFFIENYQDCKKKNIGWDNDTQETQFVIFDGIYDGKATEVRIGLSTFEEQDCMLIIVRDNSQNEKIATLERNDKYKSMVLATVSHEFRTPLNSALAMVTFAIEHENIPSKVSEDFLKPAISSLKMLLGLVNDILDYSQIQANKFKLIFQQTDIKKVIEEACGLLQIQADKKGLKLYTELDYNIPNDFQTDPNRLTQILLNLLSNSLKFTLKGYIKISAKYADYENKLIQISVQDSGIGMSKHDQQQLFQNFTKIDIKNKAALNASGCGLGLSISNKLAKALGRGEADGMTVDSEKSIGTTFSFLIQSKTKEIRESTKSPMFQRNSILPTQVDYIKQEVQKQQSHRNSDSQMNPDDLMIHVASERNHQQSCEKRNHLSLQRSLVEHYRNSMNVSSNFKADGVSDSIISNSNEPQQGSQLVLIVDDDAFNIFSLEQMLKNMGLPSVSAYNGQEAIEVLNQKKEQIKLIFMDCNMPIMDGYEASKEITRLIQENILPNIPIIGCTGFEGEEYRNMCLNSGMSESISKPITKEKIRQYTDQFCYC